MPLNVLDVLGHRGAMNEDEVEFLAGEQGIDAALEIRRVEKPHGRRRYHWQADDHPQHLDRILHWSHFETLAMAGNAFAFLRLIR